jgi:hypothetical protein
MADELKRFAAECWRSRLGRALFFIHLLLAWTAVNYFWNNPTQETLVHLPAFRKAFFCLSWPTLQLLGPVIDQINNRGASRNGDAIITFICSVPWWLYGFAAELGARRIRHYLNEL